MLTIAQILRGLRAYRSLYLEYNSTRFTQKFYTLGHDSDLTSAICSLLLCAELFSRLSSTFQQGIKNGWA